MDFLKTIPPHTIPPDEYYLGPASTPAHGNRDSAWSGVTKRKAWHVAFFPISEKIPVWSAGGRFLPNLCRAVALLSLSRPKNKYVEKQQKRHVRMSSTKGWLSGAFLHPSPPLPPCHPRPPKEGTEGKKRNATRRHKKKSTNAQRATNEQHGDKKTSNVKIQSNPNQTNKIFEFLFGNAWRRRRHVRWPHYPA